MRMINAADIMDVLETIPDPEMPVSIVDLGLIEHVAIVPDDGGTRVLIDVLPTFVGCPALDMIRGDIEAKIGDMDGVDRVDVTFKNDPPWSVDRITDEGRRTLREHGVTVPARGNTLDVPGHASRGGTVELRTSAIPCPFCGSSHTRLESSFGPTRCRMICYCDTCRNTFEHLKRVEP
jgi:ring-1,2-phenylacetyl-CoA epoxidase subunit PaaD